MSTANIGFEETLWKSADKLRGSMDSAEYKYVVLDLYWWNISDEFETKYEELVEGGVALKKIEINMKQKIFSGYQKKLDLVS